MGAVAPDVIDSPIVSTLQAGHDPPGGTSPPQCGQLTGARSMQAPPTSGKTGVRSARRLRQPAGAVNRGDRKAAAAARSPQTTSNTSTDVPTWIWSPGARVASSTARP